jgi:hypothetical protein
VLSADERTGKRKGKSKHLGAQSLLRRLTGCCKLQTLSRPRGSPGYSRTCSNTETAQNVTMPGNEAHMHICPQLWGVSINYVSGAVRVKCRLG